MNAFSKKIISAAAIFYFSASSLVVAMEENDPRNLARKTVLKYIENSNVDLRKIELSDPIGNVILLKKRSNCPLARCLESEWKSLQEFLQKDHKKYLAWEPISFTQHLLQNLKKRAREEGSKKDKKETIKLYKSAKKFTKRLRKKIKKREEKIEGDRSW